MNPKEIELHFKEFASDTSERSARPLSLSSDLLRKVEEDLNPSNTRVFRKFSAIHLVASVLTLAACPQFGIGPFVGEHGLMHYFMKAGDLGCVALCGAFYFFGTWIVSFLLMQVEELRKLRALSWQVYGTAGIVSLMVFYGLMKTDVVEGLLWNGLFLTIWMLAGLGTVKSLDALFLKRAVGQLT